MPISSTRGWSRIDGVDCLRALAIFYVLTNHVNMRLMFANLHYLRDVPTPLANALVWRGQEGVQMFFAVSGFLITATSLRRWTDFSHLGVREFYLLRFARIAPLLLTLLAILSFLHQIRVPDYVVSHNVGGLKAALVAALTLRVGLLEATRGYLPGSWDVLWSLSVEEMFYLGFPVVCRGLGRGKMLVTVLVLFVIAGPFGRTVLTHGNETWQEYSYLGGMDAIALGCLTALGLARWTLSRAMVLALGVSGCGLLILCLGFSGTIDALGLAKSGLSMSVLAVGACMLIAVAAQTGWRVHGVFRPLLIYGRRSYEIYLTHMFVVFLSFDFFMRKTNRSLRLVPMLFFVTIALAGVVGEAVGRFYSEPANRWIRDRFRGRFERAASALTNNPSRAAGSD